MQTIKNTSLFTFSTHSRPLKISLAPPPPPQFLHHKFIHYITYNVPRESISKKFTFFLNFKLRNLN